MKDTKVITGVVLVAISALVSTPFMSRYWSGEQLTLASIALLAHGLLGVVDLFRPIIVRRVSADRSFGTLANLLLPSFTSALVIGSIILIIGLSQVTPPFYDMIFSVAATVLIYGFYSPFWGFMDGMLRMGETYLIRSSSVALLYLLVGLGSMSGRIEIIYVSLIGVNILCGALFWFKSKDCLAEGGLRIDRAYWVEAWNILLQNVARSINDFGDRLASTFFLPISSAGGYIILSDFASRANFPSQLIASYLYPVLCHQKYKANGFLLMGLAISSGIVTFSLVFFLFGNTLYTAYFGSARDSMFWVFCALLTCFGIHALSFFGQAVLRIHSLDGSLSLSLLGPAVMGIAFLAASGDGLDLADVVVLALLSKASAVLMMLRLLPLYRLPCAGGLAVCVTGVSFVAFLLSTRGYA